MNYWASTDSIFFSPFPITSFLLRLYLIKRNGPPPTSHYFLFCCEDAVHLCGSVYTNLFNALWWGGYYCLRFMCKEPGWSV